MQNLPVIFDSKNIASMSKQEIRDLITDLAKAAMEGEQVEVPQEHHFSKGVYAREITMMAGTLVIGKIHNEQNLNILSQGEAYVLSIDGVAHVKAPHTFVASPGVQRVIYALEDTVWTTIHGTFERDISKIEDEFIAKNYDELPLPAGEVVLEIKESKWHG